MRACLSILISLAIAAPVFAGGSRRPIAAASAALRDEISISFVGVTGEGNEALIDAGSMSQSRQRGRGKRAVAVSRKVFGLRLDSVAGATGGTATVRASLETDDGRIKVRIDGIEIGTIPKVVDAQARIGAIATHTLEIEVPASTPEGAFASSVRWEVTSNGS